ncbi:universal stress protein [Guyparkeria sp. SCN-R1]|uniref:universal stress protein n=1 Tax=Guyparkeria sp. SCN-R1 TaxID=2341113 RepID=UPI000F64E13A|nr:universal stress protein [Guyparkeria sp. SCN-R1]RRQ24842.1 universal stress protein [Guyparkeria sp. SCN-R1]
MTDNKDQVLACIDGSRSTEAVTDYAVWAAQALAAPLTFLHAISNPHAPAKTDLSGNMTLGGREKLLEEMVELEEKRGKLERERGRALLADVLSRARDRGFDEPAELLRNGDITEVILELQDAMQMLVLGKQGKQGKDGDAVAMHVGSHLAGILSMIHKPTLVTPLEFKRPESFLIAYDGSPTAYKLVEMAANTPLLQGLPVHILMVGEEKQGNWDKIQAANTKLQKAGFDTQVAIRQGKVDEAVSMYIEEKNIDLLAMGAYGHSPIRYLVLGSTTTKMIMKANVPLLVVR